MKQPPHQGRTLGMRGHPEIEKIIATCTIGFYGVGWQRVTVRLRS